MELYGILTGVALGLGALLIVVGSVLAILTLMGILLAVVFIKTRQIMIPGVTLFILNLLEAPIKYLLWVFRVEEDFIGRMIVEVRNMLYKEGFEKTPYDQRALFLPQCLRSSNCPAPLTPEGIRCMSCGRCGVGRIIEDAEQAGYRVFIAPGSSLIKRMVRKYHPRAIVGVGCVMEVKEGTAKMASYGLPVQGVVLERDGCVDTRVDVIKLMGKLRSNKKNKVLDSECMRKAVEISNMWLEEPSNVSVRGRGGIFKR